MQRGRPTFGIVCVCLGMLGKSLWPQFKADSDLFWTCLYYFVLSLYWPVVNFMHVYNIIIIIILIIIDIIIISKTLLNLHHDKYVLPLVMIIIIWIITIIIVIIITIIASTLTRFRPIHNENNYFYKFA